MMFQSSELWNNINMFDIQIGANIGIYLANFYGPHYWQTSTTWLSIVMSRFDEFFTLFLCHKWLSIVMSRFDELFTLFLCHEWLSIVMSRFD